VFLVVFSACTLLLIVTIKILYEYNVQIIQSVVLYAVLARSRCFACRADWEKNHAHIDVIALKVGKLGIAGKVFSRQTTLLCLIKANV
jgi:hypothetical protein